MHDEVTVVDKKVYYDEYGNVMSKRERNVVIIYRVLVICLIIAAIILAWFRPCNCHCQFDDGNHIPWDENVEWDEDKYRADVDALNQKVADGMITISVNADPVFKDGSSKGNLQLENDVSNTRPQVIEVYLKGSDGKVNKNQLIYRSGKIPVGGKIHNVKLNMDLPKGDHKAWVGFNAIDDNDNIVGTAGADIVIHVLN